MARTTYKKRLIDGVEYFYEVVELPRKSNGKRNRKHVCARSAADLKKKLDKIQNDLFYIMVWIFQMQIPLALYFMIGFITLI